MDMIQQDSFLMAQYMVMKIPRHRHTLKNTAINLNLSEKPPKKPAT